MKRANPTSQSEQQSAIKSSETHLYIEQTETSSEIVNDLFYEAMLTSEKALYAGLQLQEDALKLAGNLLSMAGSPLPSRADLERLSTRIFPKARSRLDQMLEVSSLRIMLLNRAHSQFLGFLARASSLLQARSDSELLGKVEDLASRFLKTLSDDSHIFLNTNLKILQICRELADLRPLLSALSEPELAQPVVPPPFKFGSKSIATRISNHKKKQTP